MYILKGNLSLMKTNDFCTFILLFQPFKTVFNMAIVVQDSKDRPIAGCHAHAPSVK